MSYIIEFLIGGYMLHFRNSYKNCKIMLLYMILTILFLMFATISLLFTFIPEFRVLGIVLCIVFNLLFIFSFFLLYIKNNDYKLKYYFKLGEFNKNFKEFEKVSKGNKKTIKLIKRQQKDIFLQFGKTCFSEVNLELEKNVWNDWIEDAIAFNYGYSKYMEKLSYLAYILYDSCFSGSGLEGFFKYLSCEPFTKQEIIDIFNKSNFYTDDFKNFLFKIINEFSNEKQDELFARYEQNDDKVFLSFEKHIEDCANWIAYNRLLLSSCVGVYLHDNIDFSIYRLFISKDYQKVAYIYTIDGDDKLYKVCFMLWDKLNQNWNSTGVWGTSIYDSAETAFNDVKYALQDYTEIDI